MSSEHCIRAVICVRGDVLRAGLRSVLERSHPVTVVAECDSIGDAVQAAERLRPDVTVVGITGESAHTLPPMTRTDNLVLLVDGQLPAQAIKDAPVRAILPMPRTDGDVANLVDLIQHHQPRSSCSLPDLSRTPQPAPRIRMLLVDNHPTIRLAIQTLVRPYENIAVIGSCSSVEEANHILDRYPVEIVVVELEVFGFKELEDFCVETKGRSRSPKVFAYSSKNFADHVAAAMRAGVDSYVHKGVDCGRLMDAIHRTCVGERVWLVGADSEEIANDYAVLTGSAQLTNRERQIIVPLLYRHSNDEIATQLCLATQTVKNHVSNILRKVGVRNRRELFQRFATEARKLGTDA